MSIKKLNVYETGPMSELQADLFIQKYDKHVGTARVIEHTDDGQVYIVCQELTMTEVHYCLMIENHINPKVTKNEQNIFKRS